MKKLATLFPVSLLLFTSLNAQFNTQSVLSEGEIFKLAIIRSGVYKLDYTYLKNVAKIDIDRIDPRQIKLYGNGGGMMAGLITPEYTNPERDLIENSIFVSGESDGKFDNGDFILFYAEGPDTWSFDQGTQTFRHPKNVFDTKNYYFLKVASSPGKRLESLPSAGLPDYTTTSFNDFVRFEEDRVNLLEDWVQGQGSGQKWYGDQFKNQRSRTYSTPFLIPNLITSVPVSIHVEMAARAFGGSSFFKVQAGAQEFRSSNFSSVGVGDADDIYAHSRTIRGQFNATGEQISVTVEYPSTAYDSEAWLDFIELNFRRQLRMQGKQMFFRDVESMNYPVTEFRLAGANANIEIWDISEPLSPRIQQVSGIPDGLGFAASTQSVLREFIAFDKTSGLLTPESAQKIENQNLHGLADLDMIILYSRDFEEAAEKLAEHRRQFSGYAVETVQIDYIFNEFSSGRIDPVGIRDFVKMIYDRNPEQFKFLLLLGDGSFDYRNIYQKGNNFIPVYETKESLDPVDAFPADDYYVLLTVGEGGDLSGYMDVAVGRIPVETNEEAIGVVNKIIRYDTSAVNLRDWRNQLAFVSDDEDGVSHIGPSEAIADQMSDHYPNFNTKKIYLDAYPQISTSGGQKYPDVNDAIDQNIFKGLLAINYFGHGGPKGWAQERVLKIESIQNWNNIDRLPLFVTATCSFTGFDKPGAKSAGELVLINPDGGAIALYSTTRAVYVSGNITLTTAVFDRLFERVNGRYPTIGEIFTTAKNESGASFTNSRKFNLFGDPSMHLAVPKYNVVTTTINGHDVSDGLPDTLRALQKVTIEGYIADENNAWLRDFNGTIYPTIFDKKAIVQTLGQDFGSPIFKFDVQENILFKGRASVTDGRFSFTFVMPKDINYEYGQGKISYYAQNGRLLDAAGNYQNIIIGKTDPNIILDDRGPQVEVYMNTDDFVFGSITDENPVILVKLEDDNGINVAGTSIGHDLIAVLDDNTQNTYVLNDYYVATLNDFTKGEARYPLFRLTEGRHRVKVTAWDVANNPGEGFTEFVVATSEKAALQHLFNYPNPLTDHTNFVFEHNLAGQSLQIQIDIFSMSGALVKTIETTMTPNGYIVGFDEKIEWDGTNDFGAPLARGVYVYRVKIEGLGAKSGHLKAESTFEKLVIMK